MFKPNEIAKVRKTGELVTVVPSGTTVRRDQRWPVVTDHGVFDETELHPAHPTVLATAEGRSLSAESFRAEMLAEDTDQQLSSALRNEVKAALMKATLDVNGHWKGGSLIQNVKILADLLIRRDAMATADAEDLVRASKAGTPLDRWVPVDLSLGLSGLRTCHLCGEEDFAMETNGVVVRIAGERCKYEHGLPLTEWELNVPSGKLVVANDLRDLFPLADGGDSDIGTATGLARAALAYAAAGLSHAFVGSTCPGVYKLADGTFKIANPPPDEVWDGRDFVRINPPPTFDGEEVAGICTGLWWYSICDHAEFERRCKHFKRKVGDLGVKTVTVEPGVYRFRHDEEAHARMGSGETVYTRFERVREPDPVHDFLADYAAASVNPHAYVQAQVSKWPTLYGKVAGRRGGKEVTVPWAEMNEKDRLRSWQRVMDHVFCTIGGGVEWHENGFPTCKVDPSVPDVEPPAFRYQAHWYPFSRGYGGLFESRKLTPAFAKVAFRILESVISFGTDVHDDAHSRDVSGVRERMLLAVKRYRELAKKYPDQADPEYVAWLGQEGRAEAWVANFPLGYKFTERHREHARRQRWVPEHAYAVAFDARALESGHFAWHPQMPSVGGCWAAKEDAQRYAILAWSDNGQADSRANCFWSAHAGNSVPLYSVARVERVGTVSHMGETLVEILYDYGTPWMQDTKVRKALAEAGEKKGIRVLSKEEYEELLPGAVAFFEEAEAGMKAHRE